MRGRGGDARGPKSMKLCRYSMRDSRFVYNSSRLICLIGRLFEVILSRERVKAQAESCNGHVRGNRTPGNCV